MDDEELETTFLNLEFRVMLFEEQCKEIEQKLLALKSGIERVQSDLISSRDTDYWRADD